MKTVAILMTVFNRKEKVLSCLEDCYRQIDAMKADEQYSFSVFMVNDASTDGVVEAVREKYPQVTVIEGSGNMYWNQGMRLAWDTAAKQDFDFYLWIRVDVRLKEGAIATLMETSGFLRHKVIVIGSVTDPDGKLVAGGRTKANRLVTPDPVIPVSCYTFNGHIALIPSYAYKIVGNLDPVYRHNFGDTDYGVRAARHEVARAVAPGILGIDKGVVYVPKWRDSSYSLKQRYQFLNDPKGRPLREQFRYDCHSSGFFPALAHFVSQNLIILFPKRNRQYGSDISNG